MSATDGDPYIDYRTRPEHVQRRWIHWMAIVVRRKLLVPTLRIVHLRRALEDERAYRAAQADMKDLLDEIDEWENNLRELDPIYAAEVIDFDPFVRRHWEERCGLASGSPALANPSTHEEEDANARSIAVEEALRDMVDKVSDSIGGLTYDDLVGGLMTFLGQMLVEGHIMAREHGSTMTRDDIAESLDNFGPTLREIVLRRLDKYWDRVED